ncbi:putative UPF0481 protein At3g02645 [Lycium ferocissimum]|uniref:putative UPF0481 protein At3g02645 n=1 Tax=Lycium ferocissimum TaxID=112874 RepID=UPI002814F188|nr:putative UPF0481 protein At3g02645 [Lycium ferocissimum]
MASESIMTCNVSEQRWVNETIRTFTSELTVGTETTTCVFQVPKIIAETKPQVYTPQKIGLGPYQHLGPQLLATNRHHKLTIARSCLNDHQVQDFANKVINKLCLVMEPIRGYYDKHLDLEGQTLAWILAIDSLYMLHLLNSYGRYQKVITKQRMFTQDVVMLENQIPSFVLIETQKALDQSYSNLFTRLFHKHSPLKLTNQNIFRSVNSPHLLAYLHHLIINYRGILEAEYHESDDDDVIYQVHYEYHSSVTRIVETTASLGLPGGELLGRHFSFLISLPWDYIKSLVKKENEEKKPSVDKIEIPSVTQLNKTAKINFKLTEGGIRDIKFIEEEVILRNLVAYEAAAAGDQDGSTLEVAEYVDLMCGIVDTPKDVDLLRKSGIIKGSLSDEEIADFFNGIPKTTAKSKEKKSEVAMAIDTVNQKFDAILRVKAYRFIKKHIYVPRESLAVLTTLVLIMLLSLQSKAVREPCKPTYASFINPNSSSQPLTTTKLKPIEFVHGEPTLKFTVEEIEKFTVVEGLYQALVLKFSYRHPEIEELYTVCPKQLGNKVNA